MPRDLNVSVGVGAIVYRPKPYTNALVQSQFLLIRRAGKPPAEGSGLYSIPGGWLADGETVVDAAIRETREEVGVPTVIFPFENLNHTVVTHRSGTLGLWCVTVYVKLQAETDQIVIGEPDKVDAAFWITREELHRQYSDSLFKPFEMAIAKGIIR